MCGYCKGLRVSVGAELEHRDCNGVGEAICMGLLRIRCLFSLIVYAGKTPYQEIEGAK